MKPTLLFACSLLIAATLPAPCLATGIDSAEIIRLVDQPYLARGMSRDTVREMLGAPSAQLSADAWVYFDFRPVNAVPAKSSRMVANPGDTLVVAFVNDRVNLVRLCDSKPVRAFIAQQRNAKSPASSLAAK